MQKSAVLKERLIFRRNRLGFTQEDLADKSGVSLRSISNYESGESLPNLEQLYKIAGALNINAGYFLGEEPTDSMKETPRSELAGYSGLDVPTLQKILADLSSKLATGKFPSHERKHVLGNLRSLLDELEAREDKPSPEAAGTKLLRKASEGVKGKPPVAFGRRARGHVSSSKDVADQLADAIESELEKPPGQK